MKTRVEHSGHVGLEHADRASRGRRKQFWGLAFLFLGVCDLAIYGVTMMIWELDHHVDGSMFAGVHGDGPNAPLTRAAMVYGGALAIALGIACLAIGKVQEWIYRRD